jgi:hypothetical protein
MNTLTDHATEELECNAMTSDSRFNPPDTKEPNWTEYQWQEAKENALRTLFSDRNRPYGRDLASDYVDNSEYKDHCDFFNIVVDMVCAETDSKIKQAQKRMFDWFMNMAEQPINVIAETKLIHEDAERFDEYRD